jgi:CRISPR-associated protein Csm2
MAKPIKQAFPNLSEDILKKIISDRDSAKILVESARMIGEALAQQGLTTSQIRAIFGEVRRIEGMWKIKDQAPLASRSLTLLIPKMEYRARKERNNKGGLGVENLVAVMVPTVSFVNESNVEKSEQNFTRFVEFFEAILAYHKAFGGN